MENWEVWRLGSFLFLKGRCSTPRLLFFRKDYKSLEKAQGAKRRAAGAVSGEAAERPMEPEAVRAHCCVFAILIFLGHYCSPPIFRPHKVPFWTLKSTIFFVEDENF